jgi:hypothetical protein
MKFAKTLFVLNAANLKVQLQPGQWVEDATGIRGQYLGHTSQGVITVRWQNGKFTKRDAINNKHLRRFAVTYGSTPAKGKTRADYK